MSYQGKLPPGHCTGFSRISHFKTKTCSHLSPGKAWLEQGEGRLTPRSIFQLPLEENKIASVHSSCQGWKSEMKVTSVLLGCGRKLALCGGLPPAAAFSPESEMGNEYGDCGRFSLFVLPLPRCWGRGTGSAAPPSSLGLPEQSSPAEDVAQRCPQPGPGPTPGSRQLRLHMQEGGRPAQSRAVVSRFSCSPLSILGSPRWRNLRVRPLPSAHASVCFWCLEILSFAWNHMCLKTA